MANNESQRTSMVWRQRRDGVFSCEWLPEGKPRGCFILVHGMESHSTWFGDLAVRLNARGWAAVAQDRPGWGKSGGPTGHLESYREEVARLSIQAQAARERFGSAHLAGMSWGGMACLYFALRRGWLVDSLSLLAPGLGIRRGISLFERLKTGFNMAVGNWRAALFSDFAPELFSAVPAVRAYIAGDSRRTRKVTAAFCRETLKMRRFIDERAGARRLPPAVCLLGADDRMVDNAVAAALCRRAGIDVETLSGAGHALALEQPDEVAARLVERAERVERERRGGRGRVWVIGGGAVGGAVGSLLSFAGHDVGVLVRPHHLENRGNRTLILDTGEAWRETGRNLVLAATPGELPADPQLAVLAVKSFDTDAALRQLAGLLPPTAVVATLQNGLVNEERIAAAFPENAVAAGAICAGLELRSPGRVYWPDDRGGIAAAVHAGDADRVEAVLAGFLPDTGMEYRWQGGQRAALRLKWSKLMLNIAFNALNTVTGLSTAEILADPYNGDLAMAALAEGFAVMDRLGLAPVDLPGFPVAKLRLLVKAPRSLARRIMAWRNSGSRREAAFSMRQDVLLGRGRTEIDELNGAVVRHGGQLGIPTPANHQLCLLLATKIKSGA